MHIIGSTISQMVQMQKDAKQEHEELMALLAAHPDMTSSDLSSVSHKIFSKLKFNFFKNRLLELSLASMIGEFILGQN
jgi:hypothetical protein